MARPSSDMPCCQRIAGLWHLQRRHRRPQPQRWVEHRVYPKPPQAQDVASRSSWAAAKALQLPKPTLAGDPPTSPSWPLAHSSGDYAEAERSKHAQPETAAGEPNLPQLSDTRKRGNWRPLLQHCQVRHLAARRGGSESLVGGDEKLSCMVWFCSGFASVVHNINVDMLAATYTHEHRGSCGLPSTPARDMGPEEETPSASMKTPARERLRAVVASDVSKCEHLSQLPGNHIK